MHFCCRYNIVPVVLGARPKDYLEVAPANSYIHVNDFETPEKLAEYLKKLDKDDSLYKEFFNWKGSGQFEGTALTDFFCRICGNL
jgi:glycoprotein 3-alpha-L-fucosyltransferase